MKKYTQAGFTQAHFDFDSLPWLTSPRKKLGLEGVALGLIKIPPEEGYTFTHTHRQQEEVYIVIEGSGTMVIDDELVKMNRGDIIRVSPESRRAIQAHEQGVFIICTGGIPMGFPQNPHSRYMIDDGVPNYDDVPPWYEGRNDIVEKNTMLKERMERTKQKRKSGEK